MYEGATLTNTFCFKTSWCFLNWLVKKSFLRIVIICVSLLSWKRLNILKEHLRSSLVAQWVKDPALSCSGLGCCCGAGLIPWPRNFHIPQARTKKQTKRAHLIIMYHPILFGIGRTDGNNTSEAKASAGWKIIVMQSLRRSTCLFPFHLCWCTKLTIHVCLVESVSLWCKRGNLFHIRLSNFDVSLSRVWKCFPEKFSSKNSSFISHYNIMTRTTH